MTDKTDAEQTAVIDYIRTYLLYEEIEGIDEAENEILHVSANINGKVGLLTNKSGLDLESKFTSAKRSGNANLAEWELK